MSDEKQDRLKSLLKMLHEQAEELLAKHELWSRYGWQDEDTPDPEYAGIAMWELNPPFEHDYGFLLEGRTPRHIPTKREEILLGNGEDLMAALTFARRSLGMALCFAEETAPNPVGNGEFWIGSNEFWQEYATTLMWLNIASDRLRDFFLMARFRLTRDEYDERYRREHNPNDFRVPYSVPFKTSTADVADDLKTCLQELSQLAESLQEHRRERNDRVHKVATITAQRTIHLLREQRRIATKTTSQPERMVHDEALPPAIEAMKVWFRRMMKAASLVFEFEYFDRIKK